MYLIDKAYAINTCFSSNNYVDLISQSYWEQNIVQLNKSMDPKT